VAAREQFYRVDNKTTKEIVLYKIYLKVKIITDVYKALNHSRNAIKLLKYYVETCLFHIYNFANTPLRPPFNVSYARHQ
jgi:hypothetical protein